MGCLKTTVKRAASGVIQFCFHSEWLCRVFDWMAYERWRRRRRVIEQRLRAQGLYGDTVAFGPFQGMQYTRRWSSNRFEKIIGAYEAELHEVIETLCRRSYTEIINVGCAEGFYSVGLARRLPPARVYAFDLKPEMLEHCLELARLNGVDARVITAGFCDAAALQRVPLRGRALVLSDCEGYELELLDPARAPMLAQADVLVEVHDFKNRAISAALRQRFASTHALRVIQSEGLRYQNYPVLRQLRFPEIYAMIGEEREEIMEWFFLEASENVETLKS